MKRIFIGIIIGIVLTFSTTVFSETVKEYILKKVSYPILVNGIEYIDEELPALNYEGNTYIPMRSIGDVLGAKVHWNDELKRAEIGETPIEVIPDETESSVPEPPKSPEPTKINNIFNLSDQLIKDAIKEGEQGYNHMSAYTEKYFLPIIEDKLHIFQPRITILTPYLNVARASFFESQKFKTYSFTEAKSFADGINVLAFDVVEYADKISYGENIDFVLKQGDTVIEPKEISGRSNLAERTTSWPDSPAYHKLVSVHFPIEKIDFNKKAELIYLYAGKDYSVTYEIDFSTIK